MNTNRLVEIRDTNSAPGRYQIYVAGLHWRNTDDKALAELRAEQMRKALATKLQEGENEPIS